jgi:hypothetical protein
MQEMTFRLRRFEFVVWVLVVLAMGCSTKVASYETSEPCLRQEFIDYLRNQKVPYSEEGAAIVRSAGDTDGFVRALDEFRGYRLVVASLGKQCISAKK